MTLIYFKQETESLGQKQGVRINHRPKDGRCYSAEKSSIRKKFYTSDKNLGRQNFHITLAEALCALIMHLMAIRNTHTPAQSSLIPLLGAVNLC